MAYDNYLTYLKLFANRQSEMLTNNLFPIGYLDCQSLFLYISTVLALEWRIIIAELNQISSCLSTSESPLCLFPIKHHNIIDICISYTLDVKSLN